MSREYETVIIHKCQLFPQNCLRSPNLTVRISILPDPFQGWPVSDIGPFEALMLLCSYEERTKETIDPKKLESGELKLSDLLTEEDFAIARSVSIVFLIYLLFLCLLFFIMHYTNITAQLQLQAKKMDGVKAAEASIKVLLDNPTKETATLIKEARAEYDGI